MPTQNKAYLEHAAIVVSDVRWHLRFFQEVLGLTIREYKGDPETPDQVWFYGGVQLNTQAGFGGPEGRLAHLGFMVEDLDRAIADAKAFGAKELPQGANWLELPDGVCLELMQAGGTSVADVLRINPRA